MARGGDEYLERRLAAADKNLRGGKPLIALKDLKKSLGRMKHYKGSDRNDYLKKIEQHARTLQQDRTLKDYEFEDADWIEHRAWQLQQKDLEGLFSSIIGAGGLIAGLFLLSSNITGNTIGNLTNSTSNIIGVVLLVVGLVGGFFWFRDRKK